MRKKHLAAPSHLELMAHQPHDVLKARGEAQRQGYLASFTDSLQGMKEGAQDLVLHKQMRLVGVPIHAGLLICAALGLTAFLIGHDERNADLTKGTISPRSALAIPGALIVLELIATLAFPALVQACDAKSFNKPAIETTDDQDPLEGAWRPDETAVTVDDAQTSQVNAEDAGFDFDLPPPAPSVAGGSRPVGQPGGTSWLRDADHLD